MSAIGRERSGWRGKARRKVWGETYWRCIPLRPCLCVWGAVIHSTKQRFEGLTIPQTRCLTYVYQGHEKQLRSEVLLTLVDLGYVVEDVRRTVYGSCVVLDICYQPDRTAWERWLAWYEKYYCNERVL